MFGTPVLLPSGLRRVPGRFEPDAWRVPRERTESHLRAAIVQNYIAGAAKIAFETSFPAQERGGIGEGRGSRTKFAARVGMDRKRLTSILSGRSMLDGIDLGHILSLPPPGFADATLGAAANEVARVLRARWAGSASRRARPDPVLWPVSHYGGRDRTGPWHPDTRIVTSDDYDFCPPFTAENEVRWKYIAQLIEQPLTACLTHLWRKHAQKQRWQAADPPEPEITLVVVFRDDPEQPVDLLVELSEDGIGGSVTLRDDWPVTVGKNSLLDNAFVLDVLDADPWGQPRAVVAARPMTSWDDEYEFRTSVGRASVVVDGSNVSLGDWVEPEQWLGLDENRG